MTDKMKINNRILKVGSSFALSAILLASCNITELDILDNPNALAPDQADVDLFLNSVQVELGQFYESSNFDNFQGISEYGAEVTRAQHMFGPTYSNAYTPDNFNEIWEDAYSGILIDIRTMNDIAVPGELYTHVAIGQIIEAYVVMTLVDFFGDIPYSEALQGADELNPALDGGATVYAAAEQLLLDAITNLGLTAVAEPANDFYYGADLAAGVTAGDFTAYHDRWIAVANTMLLKMYLQTRLVSDRSTEIDAIIAGGNYITSSAGDFRFQYSTTDANPDSRHPIFSDNFDNGTTDYMSNSFMNLLRNNYSTPDPRIRYYFYRQELNFNAVDAITKECSLQNPPSHYGPTDVFCLVGGPTGDGYWGRDHGNADGIPPDNNLRTTWGVYPVGGLFDNDTGTGITNRNIGLFGAGISAFMMSSFVDFMLAEAALTMGTTGDPRTYLENGVRGSISTVMNFGASIADAAFIPSGTDIDNHVAEILADYDAQTTDAGRLDVIVEQYRIALWGNGVEMYNTYRRTGSLGTDGAQPTILAAPGDFIRSFIYPGAAVNFNSSIDAKSSQAVQVFWDNNPAGFID